MKGLYISSCYYYPQVVTSQVSLQLYFNKNTIEILFKLTFILII
jgi:hypothetical protein